MKNGATIEEALKYALDRGVKPLLWYNSSTAWIKAWGAPRPKTAEGVCLVRENGRSWSEN